MSKPNIVNIGSKEILAKLMSTENIQIRHKKISTAAFDVKNRILYLPIWKDMDGDMYTMFITHEVGHALFTDPKLLEEALKEQPKLGVILNLVEDARIDKKMKVRFPGVKSCYNHGTKQLLDRDFYGIEKRGLKIEQMNLLDRINLHYKAGIYNHIAPVPFNEKEQEIVDEIDSAVTYNDVIRISKKILQHIKDEKQQEQEQEGDDQEKDNKSKKGKSKRGNKKVAQGKQQKNSERGESEEDDSEDNEEAPHNYDDPYEDDEDAEDGEGDDASGSEESDEDAEDGGSSAQSKDGENDGDVSQTSNGLEPSEEDLTSQTQTHAEQSMNKLNDKNAHDIVYCNFPKINTRSFVVPYKEVHKQIRHHYNSLNGSQIDNARLQYNKFKVANQKIVDYLVKEFELKKAAAITSRIKTASTGVLDTRKIHSYRYNDDLFRKIAEVPEGKNHGLLMFVDCSGSMSSNMLGTLQQIINLVSFCRKAGIPYDVYGFMDNMSGWDIYQRSLASDKISAMQHKQEYKPEDVVLGRFYLRQYFSSSMKSIEHQEALVNMTALVKSYQGSGMIPHVESLGGTPFDETIMTATQLVKEMKKKFGLDIVHTIFLTDGYGTSTINYKDHNNTTQQARSYYDTNSVIVRCGYKEYNLENYNNDTNRMFLEILKKETDSNVVGFYICDDYQVNSAISRMTSDSKKVKELETEFKKNGYLAIKEAGWDEYYVIPSGSNITVDANGFDSLSKVEHKNVGKEFTAIFQRQQKSRVILRKFIDKIAKKRELTRN